MAPAACGLRSPGLHSDWPSATGAAPEPSATPPNWVGARRVTAVRAGARAAGSARRPKRAARTPSCAGPRNPTWPWLVAGAVTLHPTSGSAHLSARDASTFSFLSFGSSVAAIFTLPPNLGSRARPTPSTLGPTSCPHHCLLFPKSHSPGSSLPLPSPVIGSARRPHPLFNIPFFRAPPGRL